MHECPSQSVHCTRPRSCLRQQWHHSPFQLHDVTIATHRTLLRAHMNGTEMVLKSTDWLLNITLFHAQGLNHGCLTVFISKVIWWDYFSKQCGIYKKQRFTVLIKNGRVITNDGFLECIIFAQSIMHNVLCRIHTRETMHCKQCYKRVVSLVLVWLCE